MTHYWIETKAHKQVCRVVRHITAPDGALYQISGGYDGLVQLWATQSSGLELINCGGSKVHVPSNVVSLCHVPAEVFNGHFFSGDMKGRVYHQKLIVNECGIAGIQCVGAVVDETVETDPDVAGGLAHGGAISSLEAYVTTDGGLALLTGGWDGIAKRFLLQNDEWICVDRLPGHCHSTIIVPLVVPELPGAWALTADSSGTVRVWKDAKVRTQFPQYHKMMIHQFGLFIISGERVLVTCSNDGVLRFATIEFKGDDTVGLSLIKDTRGVWNESFLFTFACFRLQGSGMEVLAVGTECGKIHFLDYATLRSVGEIDFSKPVRSIQAENVTKISGSFQDIPDAERILVGTDGGVISRWTVKESLMIGGPEPESKKEGEKYSFNIISDYRLFDVACRKEIIKPTEALNMWQGDKWKAVGNGTRFETLDVLRSFVLGTKIEEYAISRIVGSLVEVGFSEREDQKVAALAFRCLANLVPTMFLTRAGGPIEAVLLSSLEGVLTSQPGGLQPIMVSNKLVRGSWQNFYFNLSVAVVEISRQQILTTDIHKAIQQSLIVYGFEENPSLSLLTICNFKLILPKVYDFPFHKLEEHSLKETLSGLGCDDHSLGQLGALMAID